LNRLVPIAVWLILAGLARVAGATDTVIADVADPGVGAALKTAGLAYTIDGGDFRIKYELDGGRSQLVWVASRTGKVGDLEFRDVWSIAYRGTGSPPPELATRLLKENVGTILGAWQVAQGREDYLVIFSAPIAVDADAAALTTTIGAVSASADRMENELTGRDEF